MKYLRQLNLLVILASIGAATEALYGILSNSGSGAYMYESIRGQMVEIYGKGVYRHMTTDVAVQGIAQDYITLILAIPLLLFSFYLSKKGGLAARIVLSGVLLYFVLTYMFYIGIALYNEMFLVASVTLFASLYAFILNLLSFDFYLVKSAYSSTRDIRKASIFLIIIAVMMIMLWLSVILPPMFDGTFYPLELKHYSTLIVQGYDFGIFLPLAIISGVLGLKEHKYAYVFVPTYCVFLIVLMSALMSKIGFMANIGENVIPVVFIIPLFLLFAAGMSYSMLSRIKN